MKKRKIVFITGATSGIGMATAELLAKNDYAIIICGRRMERLNELKELLSKTTDVHILKFDVRDREKVFEAIESLPEKWKEIDVIVNNAGNAHGLAHFQDASLDDFDAMIDGNVKGLLYVTKAIVPTMIKNQKGHIINIGSIAGKEVYENGNVYCASKFAVDAINKALLIDLNGNNIKVSSINPGLVETEFSMVRFKGDSERAENVYKGFVPLQADDIAETILFLLSRPAHVNISDMTILPISQGSSTKITKK